MILKVITLILIFLSVIGCNQKSASKSAEREVKTVVTTNNDFKEFLENIPSKNLPLTIECGFENTIFNEDFDSKFQQFIPQGFEVVGKLNTNKELNLVLFASIGDILYPYLFSFNQEGLKIDSVYLHISTCAADQNLELSTWSVIEQDITINMVDTVKYLNYIETENGYVRTLDSTFITKRTEKLDSSGRFFTLSEEKEKK